MFLGYNVRNSDLPPCRAQLCSQQKSGTASTKGIYLLYTDCL